MIVAAERDGVKVFLESMYEVLLLGHLVVTFVLVGSLVHDLFCVVGFCRGRFGKSRIQKRYVKVGFWCYVIVYVLGALIYPAYRVYIRGGCFDQGLPWATGLFEVKEHWGALGLAFFVVYYLLRRSFEPDQEKDKLYFYVPLCVLLNVILWYKVVVGCYLAILKGTP